VRQSRPSRKLLEATNIEKITQRTLAMSPMESAGTQDYNFPQRRPAMSLRRLFLFTLAATIAGFAAVATQSVQIKEYEVPTPHSRPHDPALAPDGSLWYTGQGANKLGRLDPKTGEFKEYLLKTPASGPSLGRRSASSLHKTSNSISERRQFTEDRAIPSRSRRSMKPPPVGTFTETFWETGAPVLIFPIEFPRCVTG
jgi:hypothetical protein